MKRYGPSRVDIGWVVLTFVFCSVAAQASPSAEPATLSVAQRQLARASVPFVPNTGKWDAQAAFTARTLAGTLFVTADGRLVYHMPGQSPAPSHRAVERSATTPEELPGPPAPGWSLIESFVDAHDAPIAVSPRGGEAAAAKVSYFAGSDASRHRTGIATYDSVNLGEVFTGVNVQLRARGDNVEKIFTVAPGQDAARIRVRIDGATRLEIGAAGELIAHTGNGPITYTAPIAYQVDAGGARTLVDVRYNLQTPGGAESPASNAASASATPATYVFAVGAYDRTRALVIDPLLQSTYLGGTGDDGIQAMLVHPATGEIYVAGNTASSPFPGTTGGADTTFAGGTEAFVSRLSSDLTSLLQSTYLSGSIPSANHEEVARALAVHPASGDIYVTGFTSTTDFPGVPGGAQPTFGGGAYDAFVSRLSADLKVLRQSTYVGSTGDEQAFAIAIHPATGEVYVAGSTKSATGFPQVSGGARGTFGGGIGGFVTRLDSGLTAILQSTYLGGTADDHVYSLAIHPASGDVYAGGLTASAVFPGTPGGVQPTYGGGSGDGFVSRLDRSLTSLVQSTFLGGSASDNVVALTIDPVSGDLFAGGPTSSAANTFPSGLPSGGAQPGLVGTSGAYVGRLDPSLTSINAWTFFGGSTGLVFPAKIALHPQSGEVYIVGTTTSTDLPNSTGALQGPIAGAAFAARVSADLSNIVQSTYLGTGSESLYAIAIHPGAGEIYVAGAELSSMSVFPGVGGGAQPASGGGNDGFVSRMSPDLTAVNLIPNHFVFLAQSNVPPGSLRTSNYVQMVGIPVGGFNLGYVTGQPGSQVCDTTVPGCCAEPAPTPLCTSVYVSGWVSSLAQVWGGDYITVRHTAQNPAGVAETHFIIGGVATTFRSSTGNAAFACNLDMNGDNKLDPLVEGLVLMRAMFGLTGTAVTQNTGVTIPWATLTKLLNAGCGTNF